MRPESYTSRPPTLRSACVGRRRLRYRRWIAVDVSHARAPAVQPGVQGEPAAPRPESRHVPAVLVLGWLGTATIGLNTLRLGGFAISDGVFFLLGGVLIFKLLVGHESGLAPPHMRQASHLVLLGSILLLTAGVLSSFGSWNAEESLLIVARLAYVTLVWFWMLRTIVPTRRALDVLLSGWRWGVIAISVVALLGQIGVLNVSEQNAENRQTAFFGHPNNLAGYLTVGLPILLMNLPRHPEHSRRRRTLGRMAALALAVYGIATTGSMTAFLAGGVAVVSTLAISALIPPTEGQRRRLHPLSVMAGAVAAVVGLTLLASSDLPLLERFERLESGDSHIESSASSRARLNAAVVNRLDDWLVVGVGMDEASLFAAELTEGPVQMGVHNMYLKVLFEAGLPGLIGVLVIQLATFRCAFRLVIHTRDTALYPVAVGLTGAAAGACFFALFGPILFNRYFWLPIGMIWCLWALRREELRRQSAAAVAEAQAVAPRRTAARPSVPAIGPPSAEG
jgi:O-antigen ligase